MAPNYLLHIMKLAFFETGTAVAMILAAVVAACVIAIRQTALHAKHAPEHAARYVRSRTRWVQEGNDSARDAWANHGRVYVIALPPRVASVRAALGTQGLTGSLWILDAIHKSTFSRKDVAPFVKWRFLRKWFTKAPGRIACMLSHAAVLQHFVDDPDAPNSALIFEDDIATPTRNLEEDARGIQNTLASASREWDMLFYGWCYQRRSGVVNVGNGVIGMQPLCGHAYAVTKHAARIILQRMFPMYTMRDNMVRNVLRSGELRAYGPEVPLFWQDRVTHLSELAIGRNLRMDARERGPSLFTDY
jgi:hypothetical protein